VPGIRILQAVFFLLFTWHAAAQGQSRTAPRPVTRNPHGPINIPCENCHTYTSWKPIRSVPEFKHDSTKYPLRGMHEKVECRQCHVKLVFSNVGTKCADCHADIHRARMGANCEQCHTVKGWSVSVQAIGNHQNRSPLLGAHAAVDCESCHKGAATGQFVGLSTQCYSCHAKDYQGAASPNHLTAGFSTTCEQCHGVNTWLDAKFDHLKQTGFALTGAHATLQCVACHVGGKFQGTPAACVGCHMPDFQKTTNPSHVQAGLPQTCQTCHTTTAWQPATFNHNTFTKFPLTGAHVATPCNACHINGKFAGTPVDCVGCHLKDFQGTTNPNHVQGGIPQTCQTCHTTTAWQPANFDHSKSSFPLTGAHVNVACGSCHINNNYATIPTDCASCHLKDFKATTNPNHTQSGIPTTCQVCHSTAAWQPASFDHSKTTFPLTGAHVSVPCASCHTNNNYTTVPTDCASCHIKDFNGTTNPSHVKAGFPTTCQACHTTTAWQPASFDHSKTGFTLTGAHVSVPCSSCHVNNNYALTSAACSNCHMKDYQGTTNPNHVQASFPTDCSVCHSTASWAGATFDHTKTGFPLTGAHVAVACASCHINNNYNLTNTACSSCHLKDFQGTTNPNHVTAGFPQQCDLCHTTTAWQPSSFNHATTAFPLTGAHVNVVCASCHVNNNYTTLPTDCYGCHKADYQATNNPNHTAAGFPTTCATCHTTTSWLGATFNHTWFPIPHHTAQLCTDCHTNASDYTIFTCTTCHTKAQTDPKHQGVSGYVWNSLNCYQCHKKGGG
jgi:hypothetical protein